MRTKYVRGCILTKTVKKDDAIVEQSEQRILVSKSRLIDKLKHRLPVSSCLISDLYKNGILEVTKKDGSICTLTIVEKMISTDETINFMRGATSGDESVDNAPNK